MSEESRIVVVTGATGFLGSHITNALLADGYCVRVLVRDIAKVEPLKDRLDKVICAEIDDEKSIDQLMTGATDVIHLVSNFRVASGTDESYYRINAKGTQVAIDAAKRAGIHRFIHCSTIGVHGDIKEFPCKETSPYNPGDLYQSTKLDAEKIVQNAIATSDMEVVIIRPCSLYGPGDMRMLKMFKMLKSRTFFLVGPCQENFHALYIDDAVSAFMLALKSDGVAGEIFIIGGADGYFPLRDYIQVVADAVGAKEPWLKFPYWLFWYAAIVCENIFVPLGLEPPLHRRRVRFFKNNRAFDTEKSRKLLGHKPQVDLKTGMTKTAEWYRQQRLL